MTGSTRKAAQKIPAISGATGREALGRRHRTRLTIATLIAGACALGFSLAGHVVTPTPVQAATVLALDLAGLVQRADVVVLGRATTSHGRWGKYGKVIVTDVDFVVQRGLKGGLVGGDRLQITVLGGALEGQDVALSVPGEARLPPGETALVFLRRAGDELRVVGMAQGVLRIEGEGQEATIKSPAHGPALLKPGQEGSTKKAMMAMPKARRLSQVLNDVRRLVAGERP